HALRRRWAEAAGPRRRDADPIGVLHKLFDALLMAACRSRVRRGAMLTAIRRWALPGCHRRPVPVPAHLACPVRRAPSQLGGKEHDVSVFRRRSTAVDEWVSRRDGSTAA